MRAFNFEIESEVAASPEEVWRHSTDMRTVNLELRPLVRMTYPRRHEDLRASTRLLGRPLFRSWVLLFGLVPLDHYDVTFLEFEPGHRFLERSPTLTHRLWQHERLIESSPVGSRVTDRLVFSPRLPWLGTLHRVFVRTLFTLRHKNLRRLFGGPQAQVKLGTPGRSAGT